MKNRYYKLGGLFTILLLLIGCKTVTQKKAPVELTWQLNESEITPYNYENSFVIKNISDKELDNNWVIYYSQLPRDIVQEASSPVQIELVSANYFKMHPSESYKPIAPGDSITVTFRCGNSLAKISHAPEGAYWVKTTGDKQEDPLAIALHIRPLSSAELAGSYPDPTKIYRSNAMLAEYDAFSQTDIFPSVKEMKLNANKADLAIDNKVKLVAHKDFTNEQGLLKNKLDALYGIKAVDNAPVTIELSYLADTTKAVNSEYYELQVGDNSIQISAATPHGIFNGTQTLLSLLKASNDTHSLPQMTISDYPDLQYRGLMMDIARNFTTSANLKKVIDAIASYKLNVLHFHFSDDEGWRLEIPGLEELTSVGSRRGHTLDEAENLYPGYDGNFDPTATTSGNGYYTRAEFIDLLKYANERHIQVIPEIESPGHARAAIVSMKARYNKYKDTDLEKASQYLLSDAQDTSKYVSAQSYTDNIMNVAMPSTYRFMEKVATEIIDMYKEAGVPLYTIQLGGDEVPDGAWMGSPIAQAFMKEHQMNRAHELSEYYISHMADYLQKYNIKVSGWQEVALDHSEKTDEHLRPRVGGVYCWNTVPEWDGDEIPYEIANNGYPVVLCCVNNFYMDLAYDMHPDERGLFWAGTVDEIKSFSMLPYSIYRSTRTNIEGDTINLDMAGKGKTPLTAVGRKNILGVQAQLFAETIRSYDWVEYYLFPKILGLVERGWNTHPSWEMKRGNEEKLAFNKDLALFYHKISEKEMPAWNKQGINFRLPHPGICVEEGLLYTNSPINGSEIHYTIDGTEPTKESMLWSAPVKCDSQLIKAKCFYLDKESVTSTLRIDK